MMAGDDAGDAHDQEADAIKAKRMAIIESFSELIKEKRTDAIEARRASGIELQWKEDEDHYDGIDEATAGNSVEKGKNTTDGLREVKKDKPNRSTVFLKITRPYVDAAAARVSDMLLPNDDRNFALQPEPRPELIELVKQAEQNAAQPAMPPQQKTGMMQRLGSAFGFGQQAEPAMQPGMPQPQDPAVLAKQTLDKAKASAERAQEVIDDWLVECRYHAEVRKVIEGSAKVGTGILKGPHPTVVRKRAAKQLAAEQGGGWMVEMVQKLNPTSRFVSHWNLYPDGACGDNIQNGSYVFESDDITRRKLRELKDDPTYIAEMIDLCLEEGPTSPIDGTRRMKDGEKPKEKDLFQIWYFHGQVSREEMEAAGCKCGEKQDYPAIVTMVNDRVIKVTLSPLDSGEFPYDVMVWQANIDHWAGVGVSRQMRECQKGANAAVRNLMDNAGLSAGPQVIVDRTKIVPANGKWELVPRKVWYTKDNEEVKNVRDAFTIVSIETRQAELMNILQFWLKEAEDVTGLPMLLQGQQGSAPDTVGGMQIMNNNGSTVLRRIARTFDDRVTEPHIGRYYEFLLMYGPDEAKGQLTIDARGSSALVERDLQSQQLVQMLGLSLNPAYGLDPELVAKEFLKSLRFDSNSMLLSDEKKAKMASQPPPEDPRVTAAKIMAGSRDKSTDTNAQIKQREMQMEQNENALDRQLAMAMKSVDERLAMSDLSSNERQHLEEMKVRLADTTMKLHTQKDLSMGSRTMELRKLNAGRQVLPPAAEPVGRAPDGQAFTR